MAAPLDHISALVVILRQGFEAQVAAGTASASVDPEPRDRTMHHIAAPPAPNPPTPNDPAALALTPPPAAVPAGFVQPSAAAGQPLHLQARQAAPSA